MSDLDKLIEAVGGDAGRLELRTISSAVGIDGVSLLRAHRGSMDEAISLHDDLLTDSGWVVSQHIAKVALGEFGSDGVFESVIPRNPARALLLSILKAHRSQCPAKS